MKAMEAVGVSIFIVTFGAASHAATLAEVVAANRDSVVFVHVAVADTVTGAVTERVGTGVILNASGTVLTAAHVVTGGPGLQINVQGAAGSAEGTLESMEVLHENSAFDAAVLRFKNTAISRKPFPVGDAWSMATSDTVYALGFPAGEEWFHTAGTLTGQGPKGSWNTTMVLNPGMSGGPIVNSDGKLVATIWGGVNTPGVNGINRVLPLNLLVDSLHVAGVATGCQQLISSIVPSAPGTTFETMSFNQTQPSMLGALPTVHAFSKTFHAKPGFTIEDFQFVPVSESNSVIREISLSNDKTSLTVNFELAAGSKTNRWEGWLDGQLQTLQKAK